MNESLLMRYHMISYDWKSLGSPLRESDKVPFFELFVRSESRSSNFSFALRPIFKFLFILGHKFFIFPLLDYQNEVSCPL